MTPRQVEQERRDRVLGRFRHAAKQVVTMTNTGRQRLRDSVLHQEHALLPDQRAGLEYDVSLEEAKERASLGRRSSDASGGVAALSLPSRRDSGGVVVEELHVGESKSARTQGDTDGHRHLVPARRRPGSALSRISTSSRVTFQAPPALSLGNIRSDGGSTPEPTRSAPPTPSGASELSKPVTELEHGEDADQNERERMSRLTRPCKYDVKHGVLSIMDCFGDPAFVRTTVHTATSTRALHQHSHSLGAWPCSRMNAHCATPVRSAPLAPSTTSG
mgnify:CR=1 FL=1